MFIDANVFILAYTSNDRRGKNSKKFLSRILNGEQTAVVNPLIFDEVVYILINKKGEKFAKKVWENMIKIPNLKILPIDEKVLSYVMKFIEEGLEPRDAFHIATMYVNGINTICSYDKDFDILKNIRRKEPK